MSDRGRLEPVRPWSIGACPTVVDWSLSDRGRLVSMVTPSFTEMTLTANASCDMDRAAFFHALHSPSRYHPKPLPDSEMFSEAEYVSLKGLKSRSPEEETRWPLEIICKKSHFQAPTATFCTQNSVFFSRNRVICSYMLAF